MPSNINTNTLEQQQNDHVDKIESNNKSFEKNIVVGS